VTLSEIQAAVRRQTVVATTTIDSATLTAMINEGYRTVAVSARWPWLLTSDSLDVVADTREYALSSVLTNNDFMWLHSVFRNGVDDGLLSELSYTQYLYKYGGDPDSGSRAYSFYLRDDDTLGLVPVPDTTKTDAYTINYYKLPTDLSGSSDTPEWTSTLHHILVDYAVSKVWEQQEYFDERDNAFKMFAFGVNELKRFYRMRSQDKPLIVGDGGGGNLYTNRADLVQNLPFG